MPAQPFFERIPLDEEFLQKRKDAIAMLRLSEASESPSVSHDPVKAFGQHALLDALEAETPLVIFLL
jgi:hypothetical protein